LRHYETLFIVHPNYEQDGLRKVIDSVTQKIKEFNGNVLNVDDWGKRKLAYAIEKQKFGNYVLITFEGEGSSITPLKKWMELQTPILAHMVVRLEKPPGVKDSGEEKMAVTTGQERDT
jgi:small subunit ribosomal protein S6